MLVADRLQHARVGRVAGLAAALAREAEALEENLLELPGGAEHELFAAQVEDLALQRGSLILDSGRDLRQAFGVELAARDLHLAQHADKRQLDFV